MEDHPIDQLAQRLQAALAQNFDRDGLLSGRDWTFLAMTLEHLLHSAALVRQLGSPVHAPERSEPRFHEP